MRALALTIDLDGAREYARLHGLPHAATDVLLMYRSPLARFVSLCESLGSVGTIFAIGRDVEAGGGALLKPLVMRGFEIAAHSFAHDYAMSQRDVPFVYDDVARVKAAIESAIGHAPLGFRAPGYLLSTTMLDALEALGFAYDSSVLPSASYYALKLGVVTAYRALGKAPASHMGSPLIAMAPQQPYHPDIKPYTAGNRRILELPVAVVTPARLPLTAAAVILAPRPLRAFMTRTTRDIVIVNAHAMDLADVKTDGIPPELARLQPELRIPIDDRLEILRSSLATMLRDRAPLTCATIARALS